MNAKTRYCMGATLGKEKRYTKWSTTGTEPEWHDGLYFVVSYEKASSRRDGLCLYLYKRGIFGIKRVVAKHEFDPGRINFYEATGPVFLDFMTIGKKPTLFGRVEVKVQYVRGSDYFTCPNCPRLTNHDPIFLLGSIDSVALEKEGIVKKKMNVTVKCGSVKDTTPDNKDGEFFFNFLVDKKNVVGKKKITFDVTRAKKNIGSAMVKIEDLMEGNLCEKVLEIKKGSKTVAKLNCSLQCIYECSDCIVEREDEDGYVDIPAKNVSKASTPATIPSAEFIGGNIPGMVTTAPTPQPTAQPVAQPTPSLPVVAVTPVPAQPATSVVFPTVTPVYTPPPTAAPMYVPVPAPAPAPVMPQPGYAIPQPGYPNPYGGVYPTY